jgi:hypothetical protein
LRRFLIINPRSDSGFVDFVNDSASAETPEQLQEVLRAQFPHAIVRLRNLDGEPFSAWYIYREGYWVSDEGGERAVPNG